MITDQTNPNCEYCHGRGIGLVQKYTACPKCFPVLHRETWSYQVGEERREYKAEITAARLTIYCRWFFTGVSPEVDFGQETTVWYIGEAPMGCWLENVEAAKMLLEDYRSEFEEEE